MRELVWVAIGSHGVVFAFDAHTGGIAASARGPVFPRALRVAGGRLFAADEADGALWCFDALSGEILWISRFCAGPSAVQCLGDNVYVLASEGDGVASLDARTGEPRVLARLPGWPRALELAGGGRLLASCAAGAMVMLKTPELVPLRTWALDGCPYDLTVARDEAFVPLAADDAPNARVARISLQTGSVTYAPIPPAPTLIRAAPEGKSLLVARPGSVACYRLPALTLWRLWDIGGHPEGAVFLSDGRIWVVDAAARCLRALGPGIGRADVIELPGEPTGAVSERSQSRAV